MTETTTEPTPAPAKAKRPKPTYKERKAFFAAYDATLDRLSAIFPAIAPRGQACSPLKIGVHIDLGAALPDMTADQISTFCRTYTSQPRYRVALTEGAARVDLSGQPVSMVTAEDAGHAAKLLANAEARLKAARELKAQTKKAPEPAQKPAEAVKPAAAPTAPEKVETPVPVAPAASKNDAKPKSVAVSPKSVTKRPVVVEVKTKRRPVTVAHVAARKTA